MKRFWVVFAMGALAILAGCSGSSTDDVAADGVAAEGEQIAADPAADTAEAADGAAPVGAVECPAADGSSARITQFAAAPPMCIDPAQTYTATINTNFGPVTLSLDAAAAPTTVNNFVFLARYHYYDGVSIHRIIPGFVIQGGDAVGQPVGTGNPGYAIDDELPQEGQYQVGSVAMANAGPNTNGSQFFVVTGEQGAALPPAYSLFGSVSAGMEVVTSIENTPTGAGDAPIDPVLIESVVIEGP